MRKLFTIVTALLVGTAATAQTGVLKNIPARPGQSKTYSIAPTPSEAAFSTNANRTAPQVSTGPAYTIDAVVASKMGTSANCYGYALNRQQKQVTAVPSLNSVAFPFRQDGVTYGGGTSGALRYAVSTDGGQTFATSLNETLNPLITKAARYPNAYLFATGASTSDLKFAYMAPTLEAGGSGWDGQVHGLVNQNVETANGIVTSQEDYVFQTADGMFTINTMTERVPGEFWALAANLLDENLYVLKGAFDAGTGSITWNLQDTLSAPYNTAVDGDTHWTGGALSFSPDGKNGYVAVTGDLVGGRDSIYQPIFWQYDESTDKFGAAFGVEINVFPELVSDMQIFVDSTGAFLTDGTASTGFNFDMIVDSKGNPHFMTLVLVASSGVSGAAYSVNASLGGYVMDISKDAYGDWNMIKLSEIRTFREDLGAAPNAVALDPSINLSRTVDGKYIFYHWNDTDTTGNAGLTDNNAPNLWGMFYDVMADNVSAKIDWTSDDNVWNTIVRAPKTSESVFEYTDGAACGKKFRVPTTTVLFSDLTNMLAPVDHYYFGNIEYVCSDADSPADWYYNCKQSPMAVTPTVTPSACASATGAATIAVTGGMAPYTYEVMDASGAVVPNTNGAISNVAAGVYTVMITDSMMCTSTETITITNLNAPSVAVSAQGNPTCAGTANGTATIAITGGTGATNTAWTWNGNAFTPNSGTNPTNLPGGTFVVTVTDANQCQGFTSFTLQAPNAAQISTASSSPVCADSTNGGINVAVLSGGSGSFTFVMSPAGGTSTSTSFVANDLGAGTYVVTITDEQTGCVETRTFNLTAPAPITGTLTQTVPNTAFGPYNGVATCAGASGGNGVFTYSWTMTSNGQPYNIAPTTANVVTGIPGGNLCVVITDENNCASPAICQAIGGPSVGIEEALIGINTFSAYPNPANTFLNVNMVLDNKDNVAISIVSINGQTLVSKSFDGVSSVNETLNLNGLASGMYLLKVSTSVGTATHKLIVE